MSVKIVTLADASKIGKTISNKTSQAIIEFLKTNKGATASQISKKLDLPASTVHYNLNALTKAKILDDSSFHYSKKGKEITHYELADQVIVIVPEKTAPSQLRALIPGMLAVSIAAVITLGFNAGANRALSAGDATPMLAEVATSDQVISASTKSASEAVVTQTTNIASYDPNLIIGIIVGACIVALGAIGYWLLKRTIRK